MENALQPFITLTTLGSINYPLTPRYLMVWEADTLPISTLWRIRVSWSIGCHLLFSLSRENGKKQWRYSMLGYFIQLAYNSLLLSWVCECGTCEWHTIHLWICTVHREREKIKSGWRDNSINHHLSTEYIMSTYWSQHSDRSSILLLLFNMDYVTSMIR